MSESIDISFFESRVSESFQVIDRGVSLQLVECRRLKSHAGEFREPFALLFRGPAGEFLPQRIYGLENERTERVDIFLVPVGQEKDGFLYEAVFN